MKANKKATRPSKKKPTATQLPDVEPILDAYRDAYAIVHTASYVLHNSDRGEGVFAVTSLRQAVAALNAANDRLEEVEMAISRIRRAGGAS